LDHPCTARSVFRYFDLADSFVQIVVSDAETMRLADRPSLNRATYRRMVIEMCMPEFRGDVEAALETLFPECPLRAEDLLYQLCVEVNPSFDIHEVQLSVDPALDPPSTQTESADLPDSGDEYNALLARLRKRSKGLERRLKASLIGQDTAVEALVCAVRKAAVGLGLERRPLASFLLTGRTGTGKTQLARSLAEDLFANPRTNHDGIVRIDCSEFGLAHEYSKLIGSPPGYVGHEDGGQLTDAVAQNPQSVVLFDEVEKAHPRMHNLLLQIMEEGVLTDGKGRRVSFEQCVVILTSNVGAEDVSAASRSLGFDRQPALGRTTLESITTEAVSRQFSPEFLGRLDDVILFEELSPAAVETIAQSKLFDLASRARSRGLRVAFTPAVARWVAKRGYSPEYGARELRRVIQREIEPRLSQLLLDGVVTREQLVRMRFSGGELALTLED
jgi:ATP-dependent Clp protease ATP-binding subunit ClpC